MPACSAAANRGSSRRLARVQTFPRLTVYALVTTPLSSRLATASVISSQGLRATGSLASVSATCRAWRPRPLPQRRREAMRPTVMSAGAVMAAGPPATSAALGPSQPASERPGLVVAIMLGAEPGRLPALDADPMSATLEPFTGKADALCLGQKWGERAGELAEVGTLAAVLRHGCHLAPARAPRQSGGNDYRPNRYSVPGRTATPFTRIQVLSSSARRSSLRYRSKSIAPRLVKRPAPCRHNHMR